MLAHRRSRFESLEKRLALAVTATVSAGDLVVSGDADGAVEIVAVGTGSYEVRDNGVLIADSTTLTGVNDDIKIDIDESAGASNKVTLDLAGQSVDQVYANLGNGDNSFQVTNGGAASFVYKGGSGADIVDLRTPISGYAMVKLGDGDNSLTVNSSVGNLGVRGGSGADTVTLADTSAVTKSVSLNLGNGTNTATVAGSIGRSLYFDGRAGNDTLTVAATASIVDDLYARLGGGDNVFLHNGSIGGDLKVVSKTASDSITVADTATVGGTTTLGPGEQTGNEYGHGGCGGHEYEGVGHGYAGGFGSGTHESGDTNTTTKTSTSASKATTSASALRVAAVVQRLRRR